MRHVCWKFSLAAAIALSCSANLVAQGQSSSQFGTQGPAGQIGSNLTGSMVGQGTTFGSSLGGTGGQLFGGSQGGTQLGTPTTEFVGRDDNANRFVGDQRVGQQTGAATSQPRFGNTGAGRTNQARFGNQSGPRGQGQAARRVIHPRQEIAFQYPERDKSALSGVVRGRFGQLVHRNASLQWVAIEITPQGAAVLTGIVSDENSKKLAEILVSLEPGVRKVVNKLTFTAVRQP
ncbi:MAG: BON domain-containing protein [Pirellulales bacterium]